MTQDQIATYRTALKQARAAHDAAAKRMREIQREAEVLNDDLRRLRRTITALAAMCSESPGLDSLGITDTCLEVMQAVTSEVTTNDVVAMLDSLGFDIRTQQNAQASVHAVLTRLAKDGKIKKISDDKNRTVTWRGPNYTEITDEDIPF